MAQIELVAAAVQLLLALRHQQAVPVALELRQV
jgi:hypothetical protein